MYMTPAQRDDIRAYILDLLTHKCPVDRSVRCSACASLASIGMAREQFEQTVFNAVFEMKGERVPPPVSTPVAGSPPSAKNRLAASMTSGRPVTIEQFAARINVPVETVIHCMIGRKLKVNGVGQPLYPHLVRSLEIEINGRS
jgi:hypothetical protein